MNKDMRTETENAILAHILADDVSKQGIGDFASIVGCTVNEAAHAVMMLELFGVIRADFAAGFVATGEARLSHPPQ